MGWRNEVGDGAGDEPGPGFGPPRRGAHHDAGPDDVPPSAAIPARRAAGRIRGGRRVGHLPAVG